MIVQHAFLNSILILELEVLVSDVQLIVSLVHPQLFVNHVLMVGI